MSPHGCEVQLLAWSNTSTGGPRIVLQLADEADLEYFQRLTMAKGRGKNAIAGQRLMAAFQEIGDDETPASEPELKGGELAQLAGKWCQREDFQEWVARRAIVSCSADGAAEGVRTLCGINSRRELDHNSLAAELFEKNIRRPFMAHIGAVA